MSDDTQDEFREPSVSGAYPAISDEVGLETSQNEVFVVITQAFDRSGTNLVREDGPTFDGFPGVTVYIELPDGRGGEVTLSPIHGDARKQGFLEVAPGTRCKIYGVKGGPELEPGGECSCGVGTYHRIYLSPQLDRGETCLICDVWGCHRSRVIDDAELLSWVDY
jgi:hypothetical protein